MPHYKDGTEVQIGDHVIGHLANTVGDVAGTVVSISTGVGDACSVRVRFTKTGSIGAAVDVMPIPPMMPIGKPELAYSRNHGSSGALITIWACEDYADADKLTKIG